MKLDHTEEQQMIQAMAREFAETAIKPIAAEIDREARFPHETVKRMGELGLMGIAIPERWGGSGVDAAASPALRDRDAHETELPHAFHRLVGEARLAVDLGGDGLDRRLGEL